MRNILRSALNSVHRYRAQRQLTGACALLAALAAPVWSGGPPPTVLVVDTTDDNGFLTNCLVDVAMDCSLRGAIHTANVIAPATEVVIELPAGTYFLTEQGMADDLNIVGDLDVLRSMTIRAQFGLVFLHGGGSDGLNDRLLEVHGAGTVLSLEQLWVAYNQPSANLHAVRVGEHASMSVSEVTFFSNGSLTHGGGAVAVASGAAMSCVDCSFRDNRGFIGSAALISGLGIFFDTNVQNSYTTQGGAFHLVQTLQLPEALFERVNFEGNTTLTNGGAIWADEGSTVELRDSVLRDNDAVLALTGRGGAIYAQKEVIVEGSSFVGNRADQGAALFLAAPPLEVGELDLTTVTLSANASTQPDTGAVHIENSDVEFLFVTSTLQDTDLHLDAQSTLQSTASVYDGGCMLDIGASGQSSGGNLAPNENCWDGVPGPGDQVVLDLQLLELRNYGGHTPTHLPSATSPVLGAQGNPCLESDQRGEPRPPGNCGSGAVERQAFESFLFGDTFESGDVSAWLP